VKWDLIPMAAVDWHVPSPLSHRERGTGNLKKGVINNGKLTGMQHLQIAYELGVILIGCAALAMAGFWALKTKDTDLRNFWILYALFTLVLIALVLDNYLSVNVEGYSAQAWYFINGLNQIASFAVLVAVIHYLLGIYQISSRRIISAIFLFTMLIGLGLLLSPVGARLDADEAIIYFGWGFRIILIWYLVMFTFIIVLGYGFLRRVWNTDRRNFILGLLMFVTFGYAETLANFSQSLRTTSVTLTKEGSFLFSSIPYALYGIFLINYFLRYSVPAMPGLDTLSEEFLSKYGITDREREIILKVMKGKSNADIARELFISLATVKTHLHNIYTKIGVDSRYDLLARVRSSQ
jgi:DNA-binding CsgD family transcriptional regulator